MHIGAVICFAIAFACYLFSYTPGTWGLGIVGMGFGLAAWIQMWNRND
jgi:hypothetical protein